MHDLDRFNSENNLQLEAYPLAAFGCMLLSARHVPPRTPIELIFDRVEKVKSKLDKAQTYADSDPHWKDDCDSVGTTSLAKGIALEKVLPMQAADLVAWEFRKQQDRIGTWYDQGQILENADDAWASLEQWILEKHGTHEAAIRKSALALIENSNFGNLVWDYRTLNEVHNLRNGIWA